ncbi:MAG: protein translocase subunit SecD [bacterium]|nr:protein translocase subunit SecD [bacterium]
MKGNLLGRWIIILCIIAGSFYYLYPSYRFNTLSDQETQKFAELAKYSRLSRGEIVANIYRDEVDLKSMVSRSSANPQDAAEAAKLIDELRGPFRESIDSYRGKSIKRGLDLQGGMYLVMEVDAFTLIENVAKAKDDQFASAMKEVSQQVAKDPEADVVDVMSKTFAARGVPLTRYFPDAVSNDDAITKLKKMNSDAVDRSLEILRNRIDQFGVTEPSITRQGDHRLILELPGVQDPQRARGLIGKTALLEFKMLEEGERADRILQDIDKALAGDTTQSASSTDTSKLAALTAVTDTANKSSTDTLFGKSAASLADTAKNGGERKLLSLLKQVRGTIAVESKDINKVKQFLGSEKVVAVIPQDVQFLWGKDFEFAGNTRYLPLYMVKRKAEMTGSGLTDARVQLGGQQSGSPDVNFELNPEGRRIFARVTGANVGKRMAIVLDEVVHMAPSIRSRIPDGRGVIEGSGSVEEANDLAIVLRAGSLPAPVKVMEERTVGPSLGRDSVESGKKSFIISLLVIAVFVAFYYRLSGVIADVALITNIFIMMAILAMFQSTLTVPGIAGIILTMGMAVDANVLIFERIREELLSGKTPAHAVKAGFERAFITIFDSNLTTVFSGFALYQFGTGPIRGFALTLMIGIAVSMFTALYMSRAAFDLYLKRVMPKTLSI